VYHQLTFAAALKLLQNAEKCMGDGVLPVGSVEARCSLSNMFLTTLWATWSETELSLLTTTQAKTFSAISQQKFVWSDAAAS